MRPSRVYVRSTQIIMWSFSILALWLLLTETQRGPQTVELFGTTIAGLKIGLGLRIDILSCLLFYMITVLGASISHFAERYLDGDDRKEYFYRYFTGIIFSTSLLVLSSNLIMFFGMWLAMSYNLHKLLIIYPERPQAMIAARKKLLISRLGDLSLLLAFGLIYHVFSSFEFADIFSQMSQVANDTQKTPWLGTASLLLVLGALTKSAQFPFHFWLPDTMEAPTPVSALMHAGVINAGGILILRMSPILQYSLSPHVILILAGSVSAVFGALCMIVQNDIKKKLAYSTISQLGVMMLACGLGAYSIALFHIFAHSFYKAYAFLSTGKLVEESKAVGYKLKPSSPLTIWLAALTGISAIVIGSRFADGAYVPFVCYAAIISLGFVQNLSLNEKIPITRVPTFLRIVASLTIGILVYLGIEYTLQHSLRELGATVVSPFTQSSITSLSLLAFLLCWSGLYLSSRLFQINTPFLERLYFFLRNGGYFGLRSSLLLCRFYPMSKAID